MTSLRDGVDTEGDRMAGYLSSEHCWPFRVARMLSALTPRGKGAVPRLVGRLTRHWIHHTFRTRHGGVIPLVPEVLDVFVAMDRQGASYDYWVFRAANAMLDEGGVFYDVGANVGYMTVEVAHLRCRDAVQVYAFEPHPRLAEAIRGAVGLNGLDNISLTEAAVGDSAGVVAFTQRGNSFIGSVAVGGSPATYSVVAVTLDEMVYERGYQPPDVVKIDVEGYEYAVLSGARRVLAEHQPAVIFELSPGTLRYGYSPAMLSNLLLEAGDYLFYTVKCAPLLPIEFAAKAESQCDILAIPPRRRSRFDWFASELRAGRIDGLWVH